ncbi:hypothetical protein Tco_1102041 [Tanacetum coccineum]
MATIRSCNKHNMIACVEKTAQNADFYQVIDFLTGCSINYALLVDPDLIGPWLQQFWATATLQVINDVPHIRAKVAGKKILISEATIRADLLFDLEGVDRPQDFMPSVSLPSKVFTFMRKHSTKFSCKITPLTPSMLEVVTALAAEEEQSTSPHSRAASQQGIAQALQLKVLLLFSKSCSFSTNASVQHVSQTSGGDEGLLDVYALNREVRRLKKHTLSQAKQILKLKTKLKKLSKFVQPVVKYHALWVENQKLKQQKRRRKQQKKKVSSVKLGRNKDEGILSEEHKVQEEDLAHPFFDDTADQDAVTPNLERRSDETEEVNIEEKEASNVKSGETEELDLETTQSTARQGTITPRILNFEEEAGPSSPLRPIQVMDSEEQLKAAEVLVSISRPRGLSIPVPINSTSNSQLWKRKERRFEGIEDNKAKATLEGKLLLLLKIEINEEF